MARTITLDKLVRQSGGRITTSGQIINDGELASAKQRQVELLRAGAAAYLNQYFDLGLVSQITHLSMTGAPVCRACHKWMIKLWRVCYSRKASVALCGDVGAVVEISLDYAAPVGPPPHTVEQVLAELVQQLPDLLG